MGAPYCSFLSVAPVFASVRRMRARRVLALQDGVSDGGGIVVDALEVAQDAQG